MALLENCSCFLYTVDIGYTFFLPEFEEDIILVRRSLGSTSSVPLFYDYNGQPQRMFRKFGWHSRLGNQKVVLEPITECLGDRAELYELDIEDEDCIINPTKFLIYSPLKHVFIAHSKVRSVLVPVPIPVLCSCSCSCSCSGTLERNTLVLFRSQVQQGIPSNIKNAKYQVNAYAEHIAQLKDNEEVLEYVGGRIRYEIRFECNQPMNFLFENMQDYFVSQMNQTQYVRVPYSLVVEHAELAMRDFTMLNVLRSMDDNTLDTFQRKALAHLQNMCGLSVRQSVRFLDESGWTVSKYLAELQAQLRYAQLQARLSVEWQDIAECLQEQERYAEAFQSYEEDNGQAPPPMTSREFCFLAIMTRDHPRTKTPSGEPAISFILKKSRGGAGKPFMSKDDLVDEVWNPADPLAWLKVYKLNPDFRWLDAQ